jgi:hypothetical protein
MPCRFGVIADYLPPRPKKPPTQKSSVIPSGIVVCRYHEGGGLNETIVLVIAWVEGISPVLPILEGAAVYASLFLGCTVCCGSIGTMRWDWEVIIFTLPPTPHSCHSYSTRVPLLC